MTTEGIGTSIKAPQSFRTGFFLGERLWWANEGRSSTTESPDRLPNFRRQSLYLLDGTSRRAGQPGVGHYGEMCRLLFGRKARSSAEGYGVLRPTGYAVHSSGAAVRTLVPGTAAEKYLRTLVTENLHVFYMPNPIGQPKLRDVQPCVTQVATNALFLGELSERKGADIVLVAMASLLELFDTVTFAGDGPLRHDVREAARYEPRLRYIGYADEAVKAAAIAEATVVLVPSRRDPWPLVAVEALTAARPVVLGPGVGSADDLAGFGACVQRMITSSSWELTRCARSYG